MAKLHFQTGADSCKCGRPWPCEKARGKFGRLVETGLKPGDVCYRVVFNVAPSGPDSAEEWRVASSTIKTASDRMLTFEEGYAFEGFRKQWPPSALGSFFFRTEAEALDAFIQGQHAVIEKARRTIANAERALAWAGLERVELEKAYGNG